MSGKCLLAASDLCVFSGPCFVHERFSLSERITKVSKSIFVTAESLLLGRKIDPCVFLSVLKLYLGTFSRSSFKSANLFIHGSSTFNQ